MYNEETVLDNQMNNSEETVVNNIQKNNSAKKTEETKKAKSNNGKRVAAVVAGTAATAASAAAAGMYFMNNDGEEVEAETLSEEPVAEPATYSSTHTNPNLQSQPSPEPQPTPEPSPEPEPTPSPEPQPNPEPSPEPDPGVVVTDPDVEILGVEVLHTENGDVTLGGMTVNGEEYVLIDVDGGDFDVAWHDDNHDSQIQETELIDISGDHVSVSDFAQAANHDNADSTNPNENLISENDMDPMDADEIDYMDTSDTSGLV
ncbi:MAG: hypothetical protein K2M96_09645 [Prevotella sp.]|nr:hypothetical protein [Prevotella sp.]